MRNLKRALSLTLASVMLLGMMVIGTSAAAGYDDVKENDNVEAIEVLQAVEVMVGDDRGFGPDRPVTRAEMAVVMGKLLNLDYNYYVSTCPFADVSGNFDWAKGWVGACAANGIVSGRGDGIYDPAATVTAVEAASMMMRALGYFRYQNDYADGFMVSTVRQGTKIGLFEGVGSDAATPMTRNQVAQMALNALKSGMVEPDGNTINLTTPDGAVFTGKVNYVFVTSAKPYATAISPIQATAVGSQNAGPIVELGEQLYNGKLKLMEDTDVFGRPSRKWEYDGKGIGTYAKKELLDKEYVGKVTGKDLFDLLGSTTLKDYDVYCFVDGVYTEAKGAKAALGWSSDSKMGAYFTAVDMNKNNKAAIGETGTGVKTEVYVDHDADEVYVAVINTYLAIVNKDYDAKKEEVDITAYAIKKDTTNLNNEYVKVAKDGTEDEIFKLAIEDFAAVEDLKKGDALLIQVADGEVQNFKASEVLSAVTVSAFSKKNSVTVDGNKYDYTTTAGFNAKDNINNTYTTTSDTNLKDRSYNVYLDAYGNLIGIEEVDPPKNYVFITGIDLNSSNLVNQTADASAIFLDGTMGTIRVNMTKSTLAVDKDERDSVLNTWCTYTKNGDVYTVKEVSDVGVTTVGNPGEHPGNTPADANGNLAQFNQQSTTTDMTIDGKNYRMYGGGAKSSSYYNVYGDVGTVYITAKLGELRVGGTEDTNYGIIKDVLSVSTGVENTNLTAWTNAKAQTQADSDNNKVIGTPGPAPMTSSGIYGLYNDEGLIIAAVVVGEDAGTAKDLVYVHSSGLKEEIDNGSSKTRAANDGLWTWTREVIRNGEVVLLTEVGDYYNGDHSLANMDQYKWYQIRTNGEGNVIEAKEASILNTQTGSRYVTEYDKINDKVEEAGVDTVLYLTAGGPDANATNGYTGLLKVDGDRTLAVANEEGSGIWFRDDVNVVLQYWNRNTQEKDIFAGEGVSALKEMVDIVNGEVKNRGTSSYYVSALIENGRATSIVIYDSYNNYTRPGSSETPGGTGNVSAAKDEDIENVTGSISATRLGNVELSLSFDAPDWAAGVNTNAQVKFTVTISDNMGKVAVLDESNFNAATGFSYSVKPYQLTALETAINNDKIDGSKLKAEISNVTWTNAKVKYVYADGTEVAADDLASQTTSLKIGNSAPATFAFTYNLPDGSVADDTGIKYSVANMTAGGAVTGSVTDGTPVSIANAYATAKGFVIVTIDGVKAAPETKTFNVEVASDVKTGLKFAVLDVGASAPTAMNQIPADKWQDLPVKAAEGRIVVVKAAADGVGIAAFEANNKTAFAAVASTAIETNKGYHFTMPASDVIITKAVDNVPKVLHGYVNMESGSEAVNILTDVDPALLVTSAQKLDYAHDWINGAGSVYGWTAEKKIDIVSGEEATIALILTKGNVKKEIAVADVAIDEALAYVRVIDQLGAAESELQYVVADSATVPGTQAALEAVGCTLNSANLYVMTVADGSGAKSAKASNATAAHTNKDTIVTNGNDGYIKLAATPVTANPVTTGINGALGTADFTAALGAVADADGFVDTSVQYVKAGTTLKVVLTAIAAGTIGAAQPVSAQIKVTGTNATVGGSYKDAAPVAALDAGEAIANGQTIELEFTLSAPTAAQIGAIEVTLTASAAP